MKYWDVGAPHGSELLYLFGPTVYRQEIGVGFNRQDEAVSDLLKRSWLEFAQGGSVSRQHFSSSCFDWLFVTAVWLKWFRDPTPSPFGFKWEPSTRDELRDYDIGEKMERIDYPRHKVAFWNDYLPSLERLARGEADALNPTLKPPFDSRFRTGLFSNSIELIYLLLLMDLTLQIQHSRTSRSCGCSLQPFRSYWSLSF